ncbi:tetratricopeptide repeat protein [Actinophytocola sp.]|uniref:tetratricopeptide repeat protein n=1 Tax=Actinophytocola sp. TaxID=1872138 RepID=UPI002ED3F418
MGIGRGWRWRRKRQDWLTRDLDNAEVMLRLSRWMAARWSRHEFDVGSILLDYTRRLAEAGRHEDALAALNEAIDIGSRHVHAKPLRYAPNLAAALLMKAHLLAELGHMEEAVSTAEGAVDIYRTLVPGDQARFEPILFAALTSVGFWRHQRGEFTQARPAFEEAAELARRLPPARVADRAMALNNLGAVCQELGDSSDALPPLEEAVAIRRRLLAEDRERYEPDLVASLRNLEQTLSALGRYVEAVAVVDEISALSKSSSPAADGDPGSA